jgi:hypothetical protein
LLFRPQIIAVATITAQPRAFSDHRTSLAVAIMAQDAWSALGGSVTFLTLPGFITIAISTWIAFKILESLYNVSPLHPLSHVPGPKLAAATYLPEFYHDVILSGRYTHAIKKMHEQYGKRR